MEEKIIEIGEKFLPVGTIVMLKGGTHRAMIIGYCPITDKGETFDYSACLFPEGVISQKQGLLFNHEQIEKIYQKGIEDEEEKQFMIKLKDLMKKIESEKVVTKPATEETIAVD